MTESLFHHDQTDEPESGLGFHAWHERLARHFFCEDHRHQTVRLALDEEFFESGSGDLDDLVQAVVAESEERLCTDIQQLGLELVDEWKRAVDQLDLAVESPPCPPFLSVLVIYVAAVNFGGAQRPAHSYYDRLHELLHSPTNRIDSISRSVPLWKLLEHWSIKLMGGRLGVFEVGIVGSQEYVGIPRRQALIAPREEPAITRGFRTARLVPGSDPPDRRLRNAIRASSGILNRTKRLLERWPHDGASHDLMEEIRVRFQQWDVISAAQLEEDEVLDLGLTLLLRLGSAQREIITGSFETTSVPGVTDSERDLACVSDDAPDEHDRRRFFLREGRSANRLVVVDENDDPAWALESSWFEHMEMMDQGGKFRLLRAAARCRVFALSTTRDELREVDPRDLCAGQVYVLFVPETRREEELPAFVGEFCHQDWRRCDRLSGVAYRAFRADDQCAEPSRYRHKLRLRGGIRSEPGRRAYIHFALPTIVVEGMEEDVSASIDLSPFDDHGNATGPPIRLGRREGAQTPGGAVLGLPATEEPSIEVSVPELVHTCASCQVDLLIDGHSADQLQFFVDRCPQDAQCPELSLRDGFGQIVHSDGSGVYRGIDVVAEAQVVDPGSLPICVMRSDPSAWRLRDEVGQRVMQLLRMRSRLSWRDARHLLPQCMDAPREESAYLVHQVRALEALGILEIEEHPDGGLAAIAVLPPRLELLPRRANCGMRRGGGLWTPHEVILVGAWLSGELQDLHTAARHESLELSESSRTAGLPLVPLRRSLFGWDQGGLHRIETIARAVGVPFNASRLAACCITNAIGRLESLESSLDWQLGRPSDVWQRRYFDPINLGVSFDSPPKGQRFIQWECRHPNRPVWRHFIVDQESDRYAIVHDRQLGRWFMRMAACGSAPVPVWQDTLYVPLELRLPRVLERALVLGSGHAPVLCRFMKRESPFSDPDVSQRFAIPAPPESPVDWLAFRRYCTGNFCCYGGVYGTAAWEAGTRIPMLGAMPERTAGLALGE